MGTGSLFYVSQEGYRENIDLDQEGVKGIEHLTQGGREGKVITR